jgi:hypothetical protein
MHQPTAEAIAYLVADIQKRRDFIAPGNQSGNVIHNCARGLTSAQLKKWPHLKGYALQFEWLPHVSQVVNPRLVSMVEAVTAKAP